MNWKKVFIIGIAIALITSFFACEEIGTGNTSEESYIKVGSETFQLTSGTFYFYTDSWGEDGFPYNYHSVILYSSGTNNIDDISDLIDTKTSSGTIVSFTVHPYDTASIVGDFNISWDKWDGTNATDFYVANTESTSIDSYASLMEGAPVSISYSNNNYTIDSKGYLESMEYIDGTYVSDSIYMELHYVGTLVKTDQYW